MKRSWRWLPLVAITLLAGCGQPEAPSVTLDQRLSIPSAVTMAFDGERLTPNQASVKVDQPVEWRNDSQAGFRVVADGAMPVFDSGTLSSGQSYRHAFVQAGRYAFFSPTHPDIVGSITVKD